MSVVITPAMQAAADQAWNDVVQGDAKKQMAGLDAAIVAAVEVRDREQPPIRLEQLRSVFDEDRMLFEENKRLRTKRPSRFAWFIVGFGLCYLLTSATFGLVTYASNRIEPWDAGINGLSWPMNAVKLLQAETWPHAPSPQVSAPATNTPLDPSKNPEVKTPLAPPKR